MFDKLKHLTEGVRGLALGAGDFAEARGDAAAKLAADPGVFLLDVRTPEEWVDAHLERATLIPVHELERRLAELPQEKEHPILVYCAVGGRSARAAQALAGKGWKTVVNLAGGINGWQAEDRPGLQG